MHSILEGLDCKRVHALSLTTCLILRPVRDLELRRADMIAARGIVLERQWRRPISRWPSTDDNAVNDPRTNAVWGEAFKERFTTGAVTLQSVLGARQCLACSH